MWIKRKKLDALVDENNRLAAQNKTLTDRNSQLRVDHECVLNRLKMAEEELSKFNRKRGSNGRFVKA